MDARAVCRNGVRERTPRELGRVRHGLGIATSIDMSSPDAAVLIGQATPWSPATAGVVHANVIDPVGKEDGLCEVAKSR
jgi:hypothetical protein